MIGKVLVTGALVVVAVPAAWIGIPMVTEESAIPSSCEQPASVSYAAFGSQDLAPYSVKLTAHRTMTGGAESDAMVGHDQDPDSRVSYGAPIDVESAEIDDYRCEWTAEGVTIVEPPLPHSDDPGIEQFMPAERFVGGR